MKTLTITRKKSLRACLVPYWIVISDVCKEQFMKDYKFNEDLCEHNGWGQPIDRMEVDTLNRIGIPIFNGKTVTIDLPVDAVSVFLLTASGSISNEIAIKEMKTSNLMVATKGGWKRVCYPFIEERV